MDRLDVVLAKVRESKGSHGYNAATGEYGDLMYVQNGTGSAAIKNCPSEASC